MWTSNGLELKKIENANVSFTSDKSEMYTVVYDILQLSTSDDSREFQCGILVNVTPLVMGIGSVTLDVTGKCRLTYCH